MTFSLTLSPITAVTIGGFDISPVGVAIRDDFYSVTGTNIPEGTPGTAIVPISASPY